MRQSVGRWKVGLNLENLKLRYDKIPRECAYKSPQLLTQLAQQKTTMGDELKVFRTWSSPFGLRIIWALQLKGLEYETIFEDLSQKSPLLLQYNPTYKKIPVLVHNGKPISESLVILEYIEDTWKQNPLLPEDPYERAMARFWAKFVDDKLLESVINVLVTGGKEQEEVVPRVMENLKHIEAELKGKKFFGGATIGFTDIALGWAANLLSVIEEVTGIKFIDAEKFPQISQWIHNFCDVPVIKANWPPRDKMVTKLQTMREKCIAPK